MFTELSLELWWHNQAFRVGLPATPLGWALLAAYLGIFGVVLWRGTRNFTLPRRQWGVFAGLLLVALIFNTYPLIRPEIARLPSSGLPVDARAPGIALLGMIAPVTAAGLLGFGPALVIGMVTGLLRTLLDTHQLFTFFEWTFATYALTFLIRQKYQGGLGQIVRQPLLAALLAGLAIWMLGITSALVDYLSAGLLGINYGLALWQATGLTLMVEFGLAGLVGQVAQSTLPQSWYRSLQHRPPPWATSVRYRLVGLLLIFGFSGLSVLVWAEYRIVLNAATESLVTQMGRDAANAAGTVPFFMQTGRQLIQNLASDLALQIDRQPDTLNRLDDILSQDIQSVPYFRHLLYFDADLNLVAGFPDREADLAQSREVLSSMQLALSGVPGLVFVYPSDRQPTQLVFIAPVGHSGGNSTYGVLVGESVLVNNPSSQSVTSSLSRPVAGAGQGFLIDENNRILYHPVEEMLQQEWHLDSEAQPLPVNLAIDNSTPMASVIGEAYLDSASNELVYIQPVRDPNWRLVTVIPYEVVLDQASQIIGPLFILSLLVGGASLLVVLVVTSRVTRPLETLALATRNLAQADFSQQVSISGDDEVGQLGVAFEHMRLGLRARVDELNLLLDVMQSAAESLNPERTIPPILDAAQLVTKADYIRLIALEQEEQGDSSRVFIKGATSETLAILDEQIVAAARSLTRIQRRPDQRLIRIENVQRARTMFGIDQIDTRIQALVALPLIYHRDYLGVLWLGYDRPHEFADSDLNFLTTLAGQAAATLANAQLYAASEGGRQRLSAVLTSTPDVVIVTDERRRVSLFNPIAAAVFTVSAEEVIGQPLATSIAYPELLELLDAPEYETRHGEITLDDGRTFYASAASIFMPSGAELGQVIVMRDVTHFKELDQLKSDFVATVSHDLRGPLSFIYGYASMLPMAGTLTQKQSEYVDRIQTGIAQVTQLVENLLDLNRIEAGIGLLLQNCQLVGLVDDALKDVKVKAKNKGVKLKTALPAELPLVSGDEMFLRQAIFNLIDNAVKYTPDGGYVEIAGRVQDDEVLLSVRDTGIGIAPADQVRLFEKFYRVKRRETASIKGTGLGLAIVKSIAEQHGGRVWVESRLGQGSTFYLSLPCLQVTVGL